MKRQYSFVTKWEIEASLQQVWDAIYNSREWPQWWKGVLSVEEIENEDTNGISGVKAYTWESVSPYKLKFTMRLTEKQPRKRLKGYCFWRIGRAGCMGLQRTKRNSPNTICLGRLHEKSLDEQFILFIKTCIQVQS